MINCDNCHITEGIALTMEWIADPSIWAGLVTLIVIELVLGICAGLYCHPR